MTSVNITRTFWRRFDDVSCLRARGSRFEHFSGFRCHFRAPFERFSGLGCRQSQETLTHLHVRHRVSWNCNSVVLHHVCDYLLYRNRQFQHDPATMQSCPPFKSQLDTNLRTLVTRRERQCPLQQYKCASQSSPSWPGCERHCTTLITCSEPATTPVELLLTRE
jgi:hypothetical protein